MTVGLEGRDHSSKETTFMYPGDPVTGEFWSAVNLDGSGADLQGAWGENLGSFGPVDLAAGETYTATLAIVWVRGATHLDSVTELKESVAVMRESSDQLLTYRNAESVSRSTLPPDVSMATSIYPNPARGDVSLRLGGPQTMDLRVDVFDALGRRVASVADTRLHPGESRFVIESADWPPGVYLVRMQMDHITETRTLVVAR